MDQVKWYEWPALNGEISKYKCEWFSHTSAMNEGNVGYMRDDTHIPNILSFLIEILCQCTINFF